MWETDAEWRHRWHARLGREEGETEGNFYSRLLTLMQLNYLDPEQLREIREVARKVREGKLDDFEEMK